MESELVVLFEAAKKAADAAAAEDIGSADEEARCLAALKELKDFPVNYQLLVSTQVGKRLRHLTKHPRKNIQSVAVDLIEIWKNIILEETSQKKNGDVGNNTMKVEVANSGSTKKSIPVKDEKSTRGENVKVGKVEQVISPRPQKLAKTERGPVESKFENGNALKVGNVSLAEPVKVERTVKQEKLGSSAKPANAPPKLPSMVKAGDPIRDKMRELLLDALSKVSSEADESIKEQVDACDPIRVAVSVESVMFDKWGRSNGAHKFKYRSIVFNIKDAKNPDFRRKVLLGDIKPERIVNLTAEEMASEQRRIENQEIEKRALFDCERGGPPKATTDQFRCGRCGQRKTTYHQMQTRSADEPMTTFVTCVNCNNHWKFC
ncbi:transcription elongation factor TFIIS-like [Chenopodium quinoa]|uniref:Transcription elongation factor n=1 Tax=Chenopodium quinoa TaxID=63459 RepID=A0A803KTS2_CHEQI|nr:transcription elongation factor TFIIS-like [Chenopodium quinoa]XP_021752739.1 transcription elongation factor TFIIS-like [Chenopodium quinoa]